ncbi:MAG: O-antigen ligase family protein [Candidatus Omnitrophica bacterium]|jgi:hypothetical protein|nr:O-antigen ligase family protein [Candidatus Omnitrophota bacterium]MDD5078714.1 O-antigen ligase family protein [Candidatus Omnitrophota bacterium]MDD5080255.1 O-antigen ligase family protein [Candidatus Omnitrophota bacterium]
MLDKYEMSNKNGQALIFLVTFVVLVCIIFSVLVLGLPYKHTFVVFLALFVFIISFFRTDIALVIILFSMLLSPELRAGDVPSRAINIRVEDMLIFVVFLGWMAKMAVRKELGFLRKNPLNSPILIYSTICVISSLLGLMEGRIVLKESVLYLLKYFEYFLLFFMVSNNLRTSRQARIYIFLLFVTCFVVCVLAWLQMPSGQRLSTPFEEGGGEPNTLAGYLILMMAMILAFLFYAKRHNHKLLWSSFFCFAAIPFVFTLSREGWFSFFPMILAFIFLHKKSRFLMIMALIVGVIVFPYFMPKKVYDRVQDTFEKHKTYHLLGKSFTVSESTAARIDAWEQGFTKLAQRPILGSGVPGGGTIDNQYTRVLTETGTLGFLTFSWIVLLLFRLANKTYREMDDDFSKAVSLGLMCGFVGLLAQSLGAAVFVLIRIMEPFWFLAAIVTVLPEIVAEEKGLEYAGTKV